MAGTIAGTNIPSTGNTQVDDALKAQWAATTKSITLATDANTAVTEINAVSSAARKVQPT